MLQNKSQQLNSPGAALFVWERKSCFQFQPHPIPSVNGDTMNPDLPLQCEVCFMPDLFCRSLPDVISVGRRSMVPWQSCIDRRRGSGLSVQVAVANARRQEMAIDALHASVSERL